MPSYRTILTIGALAPGRAPLDVERAARDAVEATTILEAFQIDVVRGEPRVTVRFTGRTTARLAPSTDRTTAAVRQVASTPRAVLAKVVSGRSVPLA